MNGAGVNTDQSRIRPSRRADLSPSAYLKAPGRKPRFAWIRRMVASRLPAPVPDRTIDYTVAEGAPTARADMDLPAGYG